MAGPESHVLAYDVGGSHISAAAFDRQSCTIHGLVSAGYPPEQTLETFLNVLHSLGSRATQDEPGIVGVSLAMPGPFDYESGVSWMQHKLRYLYGLDLRQALAARLGVPGTSLHFLNDAAAFLMGEIAAGSAHGVCRVVGITLGTGVGSAFAIDGHVVREGPGVAPGGEIWNFPYRDGIVEDQISTRAIQQIDRNRTGQTREVSGIAAAAAHDPVAAQIFAEFGHNLGTALRTVFAEFAPSVIVLGGGISRSAKLFLGSAQEALGGLAVQLRVSTLGDNAPLVGAGAAWFQAQAEDASTAGNVNPGIGVES